MKKILIVVMVALAAWVGFKEYKTRHTSRGVSPGKVAQPQTQTQRTEAHLPSSDVQGFESSSFNLYVTGDGTTAMGQIFSPPEGHGLLIKVGFYCRQFLSSRLIDRGASDINVKLRISPWEGGHPASETLWESEPSPVNPNFERGWIWFDVPHVQLAQNRKYIAWLTLTGIQNPDSNFGVVSMGPFRTDPPPEPGKPWQPRKSTTDYPDGMRAFWRQSNPDGVVDYMTQSAWVVDGSGENLHFEMIFENRVKEAEFD